MREKETQTKGDLSFQMLTMVALNTSLFYKRYVVIEALLHIGMSSASCTGDHGGPRFKSRQGRVFFHLEFECELKSKILKMIGAV